MRTLVKKKYIYILQGCLGAIRSQRKVKKMEAFPFLHQIIHTRRIDSPVIMWIQIRARGSGGMLPKVFFYIKMVQAGAI